MSLLLGIDEVGRGPWAGPLVMGGCILPEHETEDQLAKNPWINELNDSKKLSAKKREQLYEIIKEKSLAHATGWVSAEELDQLGMSDALKLCCRRVVENIQKQGIKFNEILIDGTVNFLRGTRLENFVTTMPKADFLIKEVSAASILAKVERDNYMCELSKKYPEYGFEKHVGYGTALHSVALKEFGVTLEHRKSFKPIAKLCDEGAPINHGQSTINKENFTQKEIKTTKQKGDKGEQKVVEFLEEKGHQIIAKNYKTKYCEIDIVSLFENEIYFTEVKYRKTSKCGSGLDAITKKKQEQMKFAAEIFMNDQQNKELSNCQPVLAVAQVSSENYNLDNWFILV